jgi:glycosyltransferase involved in cell wall biosynthesis
MRLLFPYLARWRSANRSRYHQLLINLCRLGHEVYVLTAPPMALADISARDVESARFPTPAGLYISELEAPSALRAFWRWPLPKTKLIKKGLISLSSLDQIARFVDRQRIDVLLLYNLPQVLLLDRVECHRHFDVADDLPAMMSGEHKLLTRLGAGALARRIERRMIARAETVTVASSVLAEGIKRHVLMLPNGADTAELDLADGGRWRAQGYGPTVGFVGAFEYWVDFDLVLAVARKLPQIAFLLVGGGRRWAQIKERVEREGIRNIHLTGALPYEQAMDYVAGMDVCLLPFTHDAVSDGSCPLKLFEYATLRRPIVSTRTTEVERIGKGWVAFADDAATMAAAIESYLVDKELALRVGEAGRALVEDRYNWPRLTEEFAAYLLKGGA